MATNVNHQKYISIQKQTAGAAAKERKQITIDLQIPQIDDFNPAYAQLNPVFRKDVTLETFPMLGSFSSSFFGQIVKVWYILKVFVKHDAWNEWGEGHAIEFPIKIFPRPTEFIAHEPVY